MTTRVGIGKDSHRFMSEDSSKPCILAGVHFPESVGLGGNSDGDVIFHALCSAMTSLTGVPILGQISETLRLKQGITDSEVYVREGLKTMKDQIIEHVALSIEGKRPHFKPKIAQMRESIARVLDLKLEQVGLSVTSGEGLTDFGCGDGLQALCILTTVEGRVSSGEPVE